jgi:protein-S-isoprenylcysteine O-methyltransferase Ste14
VKRQRPDTAKAIEVTMSRIKAKILIYATMSFGLGSLMLFYLFLFLGSFTILDLGLNTGQSLLLDAGLSLLFFLQHSIMVRQPVRKRLAKIIPDIFYSAFYALASGMALLIVMLFWQKTPAPLFTAEGASYWLLRMLFFLCIAGFTWGTRSLGSFDPLGVKAISRYIRDKEYVQIPLKVQGAYQWVRHPLYFFSLIMFWSCPELTADRLLFNLMWTTWIIAGTVLEERDLLREFGDGYREYQKKVPMLIPYKLPGKAP